MNRVISWIQSLLLRVILTFSLVGVALFFSAALSYGNSFQAQAEPLTPEAAEYEVNSQDSPFQSDDQQKVNKLIEANKRPQTSSETTQKIGENLTKVQKTAKQSIQGIANNIGEKAQDTYNAQKDKPKSDIKDAVENVKEKLNLDQPIYPGTKKFLNDVQEKTEETVKDTQRAVKDAAS